MSGSVPFDGEASRFTDEAQRVLSRRTREIQAEAGVTSFWTPSSIKSPSSLVRSISPTDERKGQEDRPSAGIAAIGTESPYRRARAGTVPSSFGASPGGDIGSPAGTLSFSSSPFRPGAISPLRTKASLSALPESLSQQQLSTSPASNISSPAASRLRGNSLTLPQNKNPYSNAFGPSIFSSTWSGRAAGNAAQAASPAASTSFSRDDEQTPIKTLDYLGLADTPTPPRAMAPTVPVYGSSPLPFIGDGSRRDANRVRSYSVNNKEKYEDFEEDYDSQQAYYQDIYRTTPARPRSRTAGILDSPPALRSRNYTPLQSHMEHNITAADLSFEEADGYADHGDGSSGYMQNQPTRALWLGNVPASTPSAALLAMFSPFGSIESARVLTHKSCAFVNFDQLDSAVVARGTFNGKELFPGVGPIRIGFAKVPAPNASVSPEPYLNLDSNGAAEDASKPPTIASIAEELQALLDKFETPDHESKAAKALIASSIEHSRIYKGISAPNEAATNRKFDAPRLRDIRKRIDAGVLAPDELEGLALEMLDEVAELSSDYLGNTVVQKLFENCTTATKIKMLKRIGPALAETGIHKNGTWAAQKIIDVAQTPEEKWLIVDSLRTYIPALFLDQYGNYVVQCCLRFGSEYNSFIFEAMLSNTWEIAQGRFGSRAMRACLESNDSTEVHQRLISAAIVLHSVQLATNTNGALLLTWLLDTCTLPKRFSVLASKLAQHIGPLCTHKLASLTILKIMNQRQETGARETLLNALFFSDDASILDDVIRDAVGGPGFIFKILNTPFLDPDLRTKAIARVRQTIQKQNIQPIGPYKRLLDEVGLSGRATFGQGQENVQRHPRHASHGQQHSYNSNYSQANPRSAHIDHATLRALGELSLQNNNYGSVNSQSMHQLSPLQYQAMLQQGMRLSPGPYGPPGTYSVPTGTHAQTAALNAAQIAAYGGDSFYQPIYGGGYAPVMPPYGRRRQ
ncbi:armadillo-type protein [Protomyces lactucae-debilis]|uniref:Armadillo-type protein n=1 Tax=Protomyces lactucae-debilis TaxID=2754530 RepID=A0A1Y2FIX7_PROLT|nr:armadillo-type protein [Protomyces lactucae-debilis]ORY83898.1 armadillo-type protein [Protomyces lactucae-debilis]